jgi:hypothetical protein
MTWTPIGIPIHSLATIPDPLIGFACDLNARLLLLGTVEAFGHGG